MMQLLLVYFCAFSKPLIWFEHYFVFLPLSTLAMNSTGEGEKSPKTIGVDKSR